MAQAIEGAAQTQITELARHFAAIQARKAGKEPTAQSGFVEEVSKLPQEEGVARLIKEVPLLFDAALDTKDAEVEGCINVLYSLCSRVVAGDDSQSKPKSTELREAISECGPNRPELAVKCLANMFNATSAKNAARIDVFRALVKIASDSGNAASVVAIFPRIDSWLSECSATVAQRREVYELACSVLRSSAGSSSHSSEAALHALLPKLLATYEGADESDLAASADAASRAAGLAIALPDVFRVDSLLATRAVRNLRQVSGKSAVYELLSVFAVGTLAEYRSVVASNPGILEQLSVRPEDAERKIRLLTLVALFSRNPEPIPLSAVAKEIDVAEPEAEKWVIMTASCGLAQCKIDQTTQTVRATSVFQRVFGLEQWRALADRLVSWRASVTALHQVLQQAAVARPAQVRTARTARPHPK